MLLWSIIIHENDIILIKTYSEAKLVSGTYELDSKVCKMIYTVPCIPVELDIWCHFSRLVSSRDVSAIEDASYNLVKCNIKSAPDQESILASGDLSNIKYQNNGSFFILETIHWS